MSRIDFTCKCGQRCAVTGSAANRPFVELCSDCEKTGIVKPIDWHPEIKINGVLSLTTQGEFKL